MQVVREGDLSVPMIVNYATSDLSATGVDQLKYDECMTIPAVNIYRKHGFQIKQIL